MISELLDLGLKLVPLKVVLGLLDYIAGCDVMAFSLDIL